MMNALAPYVRVGLLLGLAEVIYGLLFRGLGLHHTSPLSWVFYLMLPVAAWAAQVATRAAKGTLTYGAGLRAGSMAVAIGATIYGVQVWLYNRFVDGSLLTEVRASQMQQLEQSGRSAAEIASAAQTVDLFVQPALFAVVIGLQLIVAGIAASALTALFTRR